MTRERERVTEIFKYILWVYNDDLRLHFPHRREINLRGHKRGRKGVVITKWGWKQLL